MGFLLGYFRISRKFTLDADSALGSLHYVDVGRVGDISKVHAATTFRVQYPEDGDNKYSKTLATLSTSTQWKERPKAKSTST